MVLRYAFDKLIKSLDEIPDILATKIET